MVTAICFIVLIKDNQMIPICRVLIALLLIVLTAKSVALEKKQPNESYTLKSQTIVAPHSSVEATSQWARWLLTTTAQLPEIKKLSHQNSAAYWQYQAGQQGLYNPELSLAYQDNSDGEISLSVAQTLDFSGKGKARSRVSETALALQQVKNKQIKEAVLAEVLLGLISYSESQKQLVHIQQQEKMLNTLQEIMQRKEQAGDVALIDLELMRMSQAETLQKIATGQLAYNHAKADLQSLLGLLEPIFSLPNDTVWINHIDDSLLEQNRYLENNAEIVFEQQALAVAKAKVLEAKTNTRVNPTIGLSATKERDEQYLGLQISLPIQTNSYTSDAYKQSQALLLSQQQNLQSMLQKAKGQHHLYQSNYQELVHYWQQWQALNKSAAATEATLTEQWQLGDLSTNEYLLFMQKQSDIQIAGLTMQAQLKQAWVYWLKQTQQVESWLESLAQHPTTQQQ